jgi:hypothetical protein
MVYAGTERAGKDTGKAKVKDVNTLHRRGEN